jgi:hypothetical protein
MNITKKIYYLFTFVAYSVGFISFFFLNEISRFEYGLIFYFWFFAIFRNNLFKKVNGQDLIFLIYLIILYTIPSLAIYYHYKKDITHILFIVILCFDLLQKLFDRPVTDSLISAKKSLSKSNIIIYFALSSWTCIGPFFFGQGNHLIGQLAFMIPFAFVLLYLEKIMKILRKPFYGGFFLIYHYTFTVFYLSFHWVNMGRVFLVYFILAPVLIYFHYCKVAVRRIYFYIACPVALLILNISRYKNRSFNIEDYLIGSAGYHLQLTDMMYSTRYFIESKWNIFFNEYILMFFINLPRDYWSTKPFPIGFWAYDIIFGDRSSSLEGVDHEYSLSIGFIGEHMLIFGDEFYLGLIFTILNIIIIRKIIFYLSFRSMVPLLIFDLNLVSYFWGGMAIFGSRLWISLVVSIIFLFVQHIYNSSFKK